MYDFQIKIIVVFEFFEKKWEIQCSMRPPPYNKLIKHSFIHRQEWTVIVLHSSSSLALGEEADFEALNCLPSTKFDRSTKLDLTT